MNAELDPTLLAELRELHQSECAPAELERSVLERLLPGQSRAPLGARLRAWWSGAPLGWTVRSATLGAAALGALYLGGRGLSVEARREPGPELRLEATGEARDTAGAPGRAAATHCPLDELPPGFSYEPTRMEPEAARAGLRLDTFAMPIPGCPPLVRRTLSYVPRGPIRGPVLLVLHDGGDSAERVRTRQAQGSFEALAETHGIIVVYANAAPSAGRLPNSGVWQTDPGVHRGIDDFSYLARIVERLGERGLLYKPAAEELASLRAGSGPDVYLVGYGSGAQLALEAAAQHPERYTGVAALLPDKVNRSHPQPRRADTRLSRLFFVTLEDERSRAYGPGAPLDAAALDEWNTALFSFHLNVQPGPKLDQPGEHQSSIPAPLDEASLLSRRLVPAGTRVFDSWFPDKGAPGVRVLVVQSKAALDVGPGGSPAPVAAATLAWEFFQRNLPGFFERGGPGYPGAGAP